MRQHDQQIEALQRMFLAYIDMRRRLNNIDRELERFHRNITRLALKAALTRQQRDHDSDDPERA
jgi:hypothetical protein